MTGGAYFPCNAGFCETTVARQVTRRLGDAGFHAYVRLLCLLLNEGGEGGSRSPSPRSGRTLRSAWASTATPRASLWP